VTTRCIQRADHSENPRAFRHAYRGVSNPGPGSTPGPNRGVAHATTDSGACERRVEDGTKRHPPERARHSLEVAGAVMDGSDYGTSVLLARVFRRVVFVRAPILGSTTAVCRGPPRGVSRSDSKAKTSVKRASRNPSSSLSSCRSNSPRLPADRRRWRWAPTPFRWWRERPHPLAAGLAGQAPISGGRSRHGIAVGARSGSGATRRAAQSAARGGRATTRTTIGSYRMRSPRASRVSEHDVSLEAGQSRGNTARGGVFPSVFPLDTHTRTATMVVVDSAIAVDQWRTHGGFGGPS
jgi:hypothetical protein